MKRKKAHFQSKEPYLEYLLRQLRFNRIISTIPSDGVVLDLGCGYNAVFLNNIKDKVSMGFGVDISVGKSKDNIKLISRDLNKKLPYKSNIFDQVVSMAVLEHLSDPQLSIKESYRVLKKGGKLTLTTPSIRLKPILEFMAYKLKVISQEEISDHKQYYSKTTLTKALRLGGFSKANIVIKHFQFGLNIFAVATKK